MNWKRVMHSTELISRQGVRKFYFDRKGLYYYNDSLCTDDIVSIAGDIKLMIIKSMSPAILLVFHVQVENCQCLVFSVLNIC